MSKNQHLWPILGRSKYCRRFNQFLVEDPDWYWNCRGCMRNLHCYFAMDCRCNDLAVADRSCGTAQYRYIINNIIWIFLPITRFRCFVCTGVYFTTRKYIELKNNPITSDSTNMLQSYLTKKNTWLTLLIILSILLGVTLIMLIFLRKRIVLAIALVKEGSK